MNIASPSTSVYFFHNVFNEPKLSEVEILIVGKRRENKITLPLFVHKLSGKVTDFEGKPFPAYLWANKENDVKFKSIVRTDSNGKFVFYYPEGKKLRLFIGDKSYSQDSFECWLIAPTIKSDKNKSASR